MDKWALHVDALDDGRVPPFAALSDDGTHGVKNLSRPLQRQGDRGGKEAGHTVLGDGGSDGVQRLHRTVHRIASAGAVDVHVKQSRRHQSALNLDALCARWDLCFRHDADNLLLKQHRLAGLNPVVQNKFFRRKLLS